MPYHDKEARRILADLLESCENVEHYLDVIWRHRVQESLPSSNGWPYRPSSGLEQSSKLRKIK